MINNLIVNLLFYSLLLLSFLLIANPIKVNKKANILFGLFTLLWSSFWLEEVVLLIGGSAFQAQEIPLLSFLQFVTPIIFYLSVCYFTNPNYVLNKKSLSFLLIPLIYQILLILNRDPNTDYQPILLALTLSHSLFYCCWIYIKLRKHKKDIKLFSSNPDEYDLRWLEHIIHIFLIILVLITLFNIIFYKAPLNIFMNSSMLICIFFIAYNALKQKEIYPINKKQTQEVISIGEDVSDKDDKKKMVPDDKLVELKAKLNALMQEKEPYLNSDLNLINLSELLNVSPHILSYVINKGFQVNFTQFVNTYRVEKAKHLLKDPKTSKALSILGIAYESGFNSKTVFNTTFKKVTGLTPSEFKKKGLDS